MGVDPGDYGAIVVLGEKDGEWTPIHGVRHPVIGPRYLRLGADFVAMARFVEETDPDEIVCENYVTFRGRHTSGTTVISRYVRQWKYLARTAKIQYRVVAPRSWQMLLSGLDGDTKERARAYCVSRWPEASAWSEDECDAACIALWGAMNPLGG